MTELKQILLDSGYKFYNYCINKIVFEKSYDCYSLFIETDVYCKFIVNWYVVCFPSVCSFESEQLALYELHIYLKELKYYVKKN